MKKARIRSKAAVICGFVLSVSIALFVLASLLDACGTQPRVMEQLMRRYAPCTATGLPDADYGPVCDMITGYLAGTESEFQYVITGYDGTEYPVFHTNEQQHMADCLSLFRLDRAVLLGSALLISLCSVALYLMHDMKHGALGCMAGGVILIAAAACAAAWALIDFDSIFILFHRLSFANELWMMDPYTDMLIRLMPLQLFITYAAVIISVWLLSLAVTTGVAFRLHRRTKARLNEAEQ